MKQGGRVKEKNREKRRFGGNSGEIWENQTKSGILFVIC